MAKGLTRHCRSCPAEVIFVPSATSGKPMILDAKPEKRVVLTMRGQPIFKRSLETFYLESGGFPDERAAFAARVVDVYTDHHVTCPEAARWRGKTRAEGTPM